MPTLAYGPWLGLLQRPAVARIVGLEELNIGHSIVARASCRPERAVREMKEAIRQPEPFQRQKLDGKDSQLVRSATALS